MRHSVNYIISRVLIYFFLFLTFFIFASPVAYTLYYSFLSPQYLGQLVGPDKFTLMHYEIIFQDYPVIQWFFNSLIVMVCVVICNIFMDLMAGYALSRLRFRGRNLIFFGILATMMIPDQLLLAPNYIQLVNYGWNNTLLSIIIPFLYFPFFVYLARQFFLTLPYELEEAARIDGAGRIRTFFSIILPISTPIMISIAIINVSWTWNSYMAPATFINDRSKYTLIVGLNSIKDVSFDSVNFTLATVVLLSLPVALVFLALQKYFVQGIVTTGLKG